jgi:pyruvyl transferase EpsO
MKDKRDLDESTSRQCVNSLRELNRELLGKYIQGASPLVLWDPATHKNIGDNLLALGEKDLLEELGVISKQGEPDDIVSHSCCSYQCWQFSRCDSNFYHRVGLTSSSRGVVLLQGGGNWGDLYQELHDNRKELLSELSRCCPDTLVVGMPQSLYYQNSSRERADSIILNMHMRHFKRKPVLFWRDLTSYEKAYELYPTALNVRTPDVALSIGAVTPGKANVDLLIAPRVEESKHGVGYNLKIVREFMLKHPTISYKTSAGWDSAFEAKPNAMHWKIHDPWEKRMQAGVDFIGQASVVVTDKLHMTILSVLIGREVIYVDNSYSKLNKTLESMFDLAPDSCSSFPGRPVKAKSFEDAVRMAVGKIEARS